MFGKSRKRGQTKKEKDPQSENPGIDQDFQNLENDVSYAIASAENGGGKFFCTNEPFITKFDDRETIAYIKQIIPGICQNPGSPEFKQAIFQFLENEKAVNDVIDRFELTIQDLFMVFFRLDPSVFKGMFMKRVKEIARRKRYAQYAKCR